MSGSTVRHSYISVTRSDAAGVVHTEVERTEVTDDGDGVLPGDCFDPAASCDRQERIMIASLREYLRPNIAPECLIRRLNETLDRCCCDVEEHYEQSRQAAVPSGHGQLGGRNAVARHDRSGDDR